MLERKGPRGEGGRRTVRLSLWVGETLVVIACRMEWSNQRDRG